MYESNKNDSNIYYKDKTVIVRLLEQIWKLNFVTVRLEVHICGVYTDICVLHTAIDAYNKGFKIVIHERAVASFNKVGHHWALDHFKQTLGAKVV